MRVFFEGGHFYICGRIKDMVIVDGQNYYSEDIEGTVQQAAPAAVRPGCVAAFSVDGASREALVIVFEIRPYAPALAAIELIRKEVGRSCGLPVGRVVAIKERTIPKTTSGKIRRKATREALLQGTLKIIHDTQLGQLQPGRCLPFPEFVSGCSTGTAKTMDLALKRMWQRVMRLDPTPCLPDEPSEERQVLAMLEPVFLKVLGRNDAIKLEPDTDLSQLGVGSMQFCELVEAINEMRPRQRVNLNDVLASRTPRDIAVLMIAAPQCNSLPESRIACVVKKRNMGWQYHSCQLVGVLLLFSSIVVAAWPAAFYYLQVCSGSGMQGVVCVSFVPVIAMLSFSCIVVLMKWICVGRYQRGCIRRGSTAFLQWWFIDRLLEVWENLIGVYVTDTLLLTVFYALCGVNISWQSQLCSFIREPDLVTVEAGAKVGGSLVCRLFVPSFDGILLDSVFVGSGAETKVGSVLPPGSQLHQGAMLGVLSVPKSDCVELAAPSWLGCPAEPVQDDPIRLPVSALKYICESIGKVLIVIAVVLLVGLAGRYSTHVFSFMIPLHGTGLAFSFWSHSAAPIRFVCCFWFTGLLMTASLILSTRVFVYTMIICPCCNDIRDFALSLLFKVAYNLFLRFFVETLNCATFLYLRCLGVDMAFTAVVTTLTTVKPQQAHSISVGPGAFISGSSFDGAVTVGPDALVGISSYVSGQAFIGKGTQVGACTTVLDREVPSCSTVWGNRASGPHILPGRVDSVVEPIPLHHIIGGMLQELTLRLAALVSFLLVVILTNLFFVASHTTFQSIVVVKGLTSCILTSATVVATMVVFVFLLYTCLWCAYRLLHPSVEGSWPVESFVIKLWVCYHRIDIWARFVGLMFINGTFLASAWHRGLGAHVGSDVLWLTGAINDYSWVDVGDHAVIERDTLVSGHRVQRGFFTGEHISIGSNAVVRIGARLLGGTSLADACVLDFGSHSHTKKALPGNSEWFGSPAERSVPRGVPKATDSLEVWGFAESAGKSYGATNDETV